MSHLRLLSLSLCLFASAFFAYAYKHKDLRMCAGGSPVCCAASNLVRQVTLTVVSMDLQSKYCGGPPLPVANGGCAR